MPTSTGVPSGNTVQTYNTVNGVRTVQQMIDELRRVGWPGDGDPITVYARTTRGAVSPTNGGAPVQPSGGSGGNTGGGGAAPSANTGSGTVNVAPIEQLKLQTQLDIANVNAQSEKYKNDLNDAYLRARMNLLEIPEMQLIDERTRHQMALTSAAEMSRIAGYMVTPADIETSLKGSGINFANGVPTLEREKQQHDIAMDLADLQANPRTLAQGLMAGGMGQEQAAGVMSSMPLYQTLTAQGYVAPTPRGPTGGGSIISPIGQGNQTGGGANPHFQFVAGHQLSPQTVNTWGTNQTNLVSGMASLSGQDPDAFWADYKASTPQGSKNPLTTYL
jgi:hypothetical protein